MALAFTLIRLAQCELGQSERLRGIIEVLEYQLAIASLP
jgi:hypothetical protein